MKKDEEESCGRTDYTYLNCWGCIFVGLRRERDSWRENERKGKKDRDKTRD